MPKLFRMSLKADKIYMEKKKEAFATGNVKLQSGFYFVSGQIRVYLQGNET